MAPVTATILDGKATAAAVKAELAGKVADLRTDLTAELLAQRVSDAMVRLGEINAEWDQALPRVDLTAFIVGPKGMTEEDIANINGVIKAASEDPEVLEGYAKMGTVIEYQTVEEAEQTMLIIQNAFIQAAPLVTGH